MKVACVLPVHNEEAILETSVRTAHAWGRGRFGADFTLILSENASTDATPRIADALASELEGVRVVKSSQAGKGGAIKRGMAACDDADAYLMMDADLSTDLASAAKLVERIGSGADVAIGSRRMPDSAVRRSLLRRVSTASYAWLGQAVLGLGVRDIQCGCKAFSRRVRDAIVPSVQDEGWFFDTELLARCRRAGYGVSEIGVRWAEASRRPSKVKLHLLAPQFVAKIFSLRHTLSSNA